MSRGVKVVEYVSGVESREINIIIINHYQINSVSHVMVRRNSHKSIK